MAGFTAGVALLICNKSESHLNCIHSVQVVFYPKILKTRTLGLV